LEPAVFALLDALLLGRREELPSALYGKFRASGSLHLLALSGLHLGILFILLCLLLRFLPDRRVRRLIAGSLLLGYVFLVGWRPSLERAVVMLLVAAAGFTLDRESEPLHLLGLAASGLLVLHPHYAFDLSFQLSFLSLAGILILGPLLHRFWQPYLPAFLGWPLGASLSAQIATAPLILYHFGAIHPVGVAAAVLLIPLVGIFLGSGILFVGFSFLPIPLSGWIGEVLSLLYRFIDVCLDLFSRVSGLYLAWRPVYWLTFAVLLLPLLIEARGRWRIRPL
ncbi:MAG: ComEC/Rec2 family competence protein, partial [Spirochaetales bacterium]|nr:ComEC/Rec2 family competence protein [Spirochaetales bacterium]